MCERQKEFILSIINTLALLFMLGANSHRLEGLDGYTSVILNGTAFSAANITSPLSRKLNYRLGTMET